MKMPKHTCPSIDKVIKSIRSALNEADVKLDEDDVNEVERANRIFRDIVWELRDLEDQMESIRSDNSTLRTIAEHYSNKCDELEAKVDDLENNQ